MEFEPGADENDRQSEGMTDEQLRKLEAAGFSVKNGLSYCAGDTAFYRSALIGYAESSDSRISELLSALADNDPERYRVLVHALGSGSRTVGADDVSGLAKELEDAAADADPDSLKQRSARLEKALADKAAVIKELLK